MIRKLLEYITNRKRSDSTSEISTGKVVPTTLIKSKNTSQSLQYGLKSYSQ